MDRDKDRDISEKIALGMPGAPPSNESMFDQRLFNTSQVSPLIIRDSFNLFLSLSPRVLIQDWDYWMMYTMCMISHGELEEEQPRLSTSQAKWLIKIYTEMMLRN